MTTDRRMRASDQDQDAEKPFRPGCPRYLATLRFAGDDVTC